MSGWLARFRGLTPRAENAECVEIRPVATPDAGFGDFGKSGATLPAKDDPAYAADTLRRAERVLSAEALADEAELAVRGEPLP